MSEEIKEILYYFEKYHFEDTMIDGKETKLLYDYIIDLQNQLQQKENIINELDKVIIELKKQIEEEGKNYREIIGNFVDKLQKLKGINNSEIHN